MRRRCALSAVSMALLTAALSLGAAQPEGASEEGTVSLVAVRVEPERPAADALCRLAVRIRNDGPRIASAFAFEVRLDGEPLEVYRDQLFYLPVAPEQTADLDLFNFWMSEGGRPAPSDGSLEVEVILREAQWFDLRTEGEGTEEVVTWTPAGAVAGLPSSRSLVVTLAQ